MRWLFSWLAVLFALSGLATSDESKPVINDALVAAESQKRSDEEVRNQIQTRLANEPQLKGFTIKVTVDQHHVVLDGSIATAAQHDLALQIAKEQADGREVLDSLFVIPEGS